MDSPNLDRMLRIKTNSVRGGTIEHIFLQNIKVGQVGDAIFRVNFLYEEGDIDRFTPIVRDVHMSNITAEKGRYGLYLRGYERSPVQNVYLENCDFKNLERANLLEHIRDIHFENVTMNGRKVTTVEEANEL